MKKVLHVEGSTPAEFVKNYTDAMEQLAGYEIIREKDLPDGSMYLFYETGEDPEDEIEKLRKAAEASFQENGPYHFIPAPKDEPAGTDTFVITISATIPGQRYCCECDNYKWGIGCPYRKGHIRHMDPACGMFNVLIERR